MNAFRKSALTATVVGTLALTGCLSGGGGGNDEKEEVLRQQQVRINNNFFVVDEGQLPFGALADVPLYNNTSRWSGVLDGAGYRIEVPENWNGHLVMYAHGYRGTGSTLTVDNPPMRKYLLDNGFAWAASSYSTNYYDVRAGVEDTNALALAFNAIAEENGRTLPAPSKYYITGFSLGGHVTAAAIEQETKDTANNVVDYVGAAPFCGVVGDAELFNYFAGYTIALSAFAGIPVETFPLSETEAAERLAAARSTLWTDFANDQSADGLTAQGQLLFQTLKNLSGGERPIYREAFEEFQLLLQSFAGSDGTVDGILLDNIVDTTGLTYRFETELGEPLSNDEINFNSAIAQAEADPEANGPRDDGLRWVPRINGEFDIPVVSAHTTGDLFVPFLMEQVYRERTIASGNDEWLVQRAIRSPGHCQFTLDEIDATFDAMIQWEQQNIVPTGENDDILDPEKVADPAFGCTYTIDGPVSGSDPFIRFDLPPCNPT
ncbi:alpha/beta hydrolase [Halopseudomonas oceani]|uniref:alpha/beta hydrolase n=1 Tax=Halopseudomonas oceani TaxID=1708783 RepID=UPI0011AFC680|nr:alpha/beta hydrolase [Halopseudomonas oceani]GGE42621.1 alpha/beta hydrolase [Halopseudomonas oceani]